MKDTQPFIPGDQTWQQIITTMPYTTHIIPKGTVYHPANYPERIAVLSQGLFKVFLADATGEERFMWMIEPYSLIQYRPNHTFSHILIAATPITLLCIDKSHFLTHIRQSPALFDLYIDDIYQKYTYCIEKLLVTDTHNSQFKVYSFLLHLACRYGTTQPDGTLLIDNILTRQDISSITGVHRTNIIKYLTHLEQLSIITKDRKHIRILDLPALETLVTSLDII